MIPGVKRIIFIRAGRYDYFEFEKGESSLLVGTNNIGKTSVIESLQFLFIGNFNEMKFGKHSIEETKKYYFKSEESYVMFECLTNKGKYVTLGLHGMGELRGFDIERFAFTGVYDKKLFVKNDNYIRQFKDVKSEIDQEGRYFRKLEAKDMRTCVTGSIEDAQIALGIVPIKDEGKYGNFAQVFKNMLRLNKLTQHEMKETLLQVVDIFHKKEINLATEYGREFAIARQQRDKLTQLQRTLPDIEKLECQWGVHVSTRKDIPAFYEHLTRVKIDTSKKLDADNERMNTMIGQSKEIIVTLTNNIGLLDESIKEDSRQQGEIGSNLKKLAKNENEFVDFIEKLHVEKLSNTKIELNTLRGKLQANDETVEKIEEDIRKKKLALKTLETSKEHFAILAGTILRTHFDEDDIRDIFKVLNPSILSTPVKQDAIDVTNEAAVIKYLNEIKNAIKDGVFHWNGVDVDLDSLPASDEPLCDIKTLEEQIREAETYITKRTDALETAKNEAAIKLQVKKLEADEHDMSVKLTLWNAHHDELKNKPEWEKQLAGVKLVISENEKQRGKKAQEKIDESDKIRKCENQIVLTNETIAKVFRERYDEPDQSWPAGLVNIEWTDDFFEAAEQYRALHKTYAETGTIVEEILQGIHRNAAAAGDLFRGSSIQEQVESVIGTKDLIGEMTELCNKHWISCTSSLKAGLSNMLKDLDELDNSFDSFNRILGGMHISNLQKVSIKVVEWKEQTRKYRDMIEPESSLFMNAAESERAVEEVSKMIETRPIIRLADLFGIHFEVEEKDGTKKTYDEIDAIQSNGTTIMIKLLINIVLLRGMMRPAVMKNIGMSLPYYLDEFSNLHLDNLHELVDKTIELGFCPILAGTTPLAVTEHIYFVEWADEKQNVAVLENYKHIRREVKRNVNEEQPANEIT